MLFKTIWLSCVLLCMSVRRHEGETWPHSGLWPAGVSLLRRHDVRLGFTRLCPECGGLLRLPVRQRHRGEQHANTRSVSALHCRCQAKWKMVLGKIPFSLLQIAVNRTSSSPSFSPSPPSWTASPLCHRVSSTTTLAPWWHDSLQCESDLDFDRSDWGEVVKFFL